MARRMANIALIAGVLAVLVTLFLGRPALARLQGPNSAYSGPWSFSR